MVDKARKANLGTLIGVIGVAAIALVLAWMRTYLSMNMAVRRSKCGWMGLDGMRAMCAQRK